MPENLLNLENVTAHVPGDASRVLLDGVSLGVERGDRIGVVGLNGGGKSTLLDVITDERPVEGGRVSRVGGLRMAHLVQHDRFPAGSTVRDIVLAGYGADHEWAADPRVRDVLDGLGITPKGAGADALDRPTEGLSGGEKRRIALAAALVGDLDLVVLDEPTNHLDVEGIGWLARHLTERRIALVVVTHDRWFLDTVCTRTWEVANGRVESYTGGYADWIYARAERSRQADAAEQRRRNLARKELAWLRRGPPARTSKPRYRIESAEALIADVPAPRDTVELMQFATNRLGRTVLELEDATVAIAGRTLLDRVTWRLGPGDRVGIVGVNGSGKTTLLRALSGDRELDAGRRVQGSTVKMAQLTQELVDLPPEMRVLEATEAVAKYVRLGKQEMTASQVLERLGFPASRQWTPVGRLSGGERRRLQLTRLLMDEPNVLLLDEPTNDLDVDTLAGLEDLLDGWPGTLVVVSHDRYLTERVCDQVVALFGDGTLTHLPGGIGEYLARRASADRITAGPAATAATPGATAARPAAPKVDAAAQRTARKDAQRLERRMDQLTKREEKLHAQLAEAATDPARLQELDRELRDVVAERESVEIEWLEAAERAEG
ncbi:ABC transporter, ATP-binding subunit [Pseudonocardia sp. Ae168_Ps1]|uniref:ABC-F family ATP-binding cassette domain-containing protein n=1 Tax=unclassified Pseudonocardia TaxID=2619320 RepID=UPI0001FFEC82|nr:MULTISPECIES: ABC-F family ATP-binding cassette domain-containing protein [unclassified Pseudonocardia]OLL75621.1 ABC transporter, ATP-binding subunit [Pseudonocardia sp. Ae150A_Ps1]OLL81619.1 ABC transporter, ATP-binding subunit [Pseudonocardia sp. Ae168_Ps1]OLL84267.1 ABC transporter, ATP-binding subunit [Pseudonocardia sp. Ae263_Ps1]OLL95714.1 ABC transporter, ATP-binding subunit [Pseudonocardia sp. Ae356_Ps1]OLM16391.1 ABC transporter, ATP-binding subunit [Pseudonocardia sp. Ae707_Ps1]